MKTFLDHLGFGLLIALVCLGVGGCALLMSHADKLEAEAYAIKRGVESRP